MAGNAEGLEGHGGETLREDLGTDLRSTGNVATVRQRTTEGWKRQPEPRKVMRHGGRGGSGWPCVCVSRTKVWRRLGFGACRGSKSREGREYSVPKRRVLGQGQWCQRWDPSGKCVNGHQEKATGARGRAAQESGGASTAAILPGGGGCDFTRGRALGMDPKGGLSEHLRAVGVVLYSKQL